MVPLFGGNARDAVQKHKKRTNGSRTSRSGRSHDSTDTILGQNEKTRGKGRNNEGLGRGTEAWLFALVHALETNSIGEEEFKKLDTECHNLCGYLEKASSLKTDCKSLEYGPFHGVAYI